MPTRLPPPQLVSRAESEHTFADGQRRIVVTETYDLGGGRTRQAVSYPLMPGEVTAALERDRQAQEQVRLARLREQTMTYGSPSPILGAYDTRRPASADEFRTEHGKGALALLDAVERDTTTLLAGMREIASGAAANQDLVPAARERVARERIADLTRSLTSQATRLHSLVATHAAKRAEVDALLHSRIRTMSPAEVAIASDIRRELMGLADSARNAALVAALQTGDELPLLAVAAWPAALDRDGMRVSGTTTLTDRATIVAKSREIVGGDAYVAESEVGRIGAVATACISRACHVIDDSIIRQRDYTSSLAELTEARRPLSRAFGDTYSEFGRRLAAS